MKKCNDCGKLIHEQFTECPHCKTTFSAPIPVSPGRPVPAAAGAGYAAPAVADMAATRAPVSVAPAGEVASFWIRFGAYAIDYFITIAPMMVMGFVVGVMAGVQGAQGQEPPALLNAVIGLGYLVTFGIWIFNAIYLQGTTGQSLGKRVCRIIVLRDTGEVLGMGRILLRELFKSTVSGWICMMGFIWQAFDNDGQAWHDKVAGSHVFYT